MYYHIVLISHIMNSMVMDTTTLDSLGHKCPRYMIHYDVLSHALPI